MDSMFSQFPNLAWTVVIFVVAVVVLYLARGAAHGVISSFFQLIYGGLRVASRSVALAERRLKERNREVLISLGKEQSERELEREFFRINKFVERDLGGYPKLQRSIQEQITRISEDYQNCGEVPPPTPEWVRAVESVAKLNLKEQGNALTQQILEAAQEQHREALQDYRQATAERHALLKRMAPYWRKLTNSVDQIGNHLEELKKRALKVDNEMTRYEEIIAHTDKAERMLKASVVTQFGIALIVILIAGFGAYFNFQLIAYPMSEMVNASNRLGGVKVSDIAALVLIFIEITMGIFLLESLHVTKLFPIIGSMDDRMRVRGIWLFCIILFSMALMEAGLAFMRDFLATQDRALDATLTGAAVDDSSNITWIALAVNMGMGFFLPLALVVVAIPLEYLLHTGRTVVGMFLELLLRLLAVALRVSANIFRHVGRFAVHIYDAIIFFPLWVESLFSRSKTAKVDELDSSSNHVIEKSDYFRNEASK